MITTLRRALAVAASAILALAPLTAGDPPLKIGYSDYISFTAWEIAQQKGWFKAAGVEVELVWFEYAPSMEAFQAGKIDALNVASPDMLVMAGAGKKRSTAVLITDYSNGNDMIIAKPGIANVAALKGLKIGVEVGLVDHLLLQKALESASLKESDVTLVNMPTTETPQALKGGSVDAVACWQPNANSTLKLVPGSKPVFTSASAPGLIYDVLTVGDESLKARRADWVKVAKVWGQVAAFIADPKTRAEAGDIMGAKVGVKGSEYLRFLPGSRLHTLAENVPVLDAAKKSDLATLLGSLVVSDQFNTAMKAYDVKLDLATMIDGSLVAEAVKP